MPAPLVPELPEDEPVSDEVPLVPELVLPLLASLPADGRVVVELVLPLWAKAMPAAPIMDTRTASRSFFMVSPCKKTVIAPTSAEGKPLDRVEAAGSVFGRFANNPLQQGGKAMLSFTTSGACRFSSAARSAVR
jgi:hypothetical protein